MLRRLSRLAPPLAIATLLPLAVLAQRMEEEVPRRRAVLEPVESPSSIGFEMVQEAPAPTPIEPVELTAPKATRDSENARLQDQAAAALARCEQMMAEVRAQAEIFEQRRPGLYLPDRLRRMLELDFADVVARQDVNSSASTADQLAEILVGVARWLEQTGRCTGPADVDAVRRTVSDGTIRAIADRLPAWNLELALAPEPSVGYACGPGGCTELPALTIVENVGGRAVVLGTESVRTDDPRLYAAYRSHADALERRGREIATLLGLPARER